MHTRACLRGTLLTCQPRLLVGAELENNGKGSSRGDGLHCWGNGGNWGGCVVLGAGRSGRAVATSTQERAAVATSHRVLVARARTSAHRTYSRRAAVKSSAATRALHHGAACGAGWAWMGVDGGGSSRARWEAAPRAWGAAPACQCCTISSHEAGVQQAQGHRPGPGAACLHLRWGSISPQFAALRPTHPGTAAAACCTRHRTAARAARHCGLIATPLRRGDHFGMAGGHSLTPGTAQPGSGRSAAAEREWGRGGGGARRTPRAASVGRSSQHCCSRRVGCCIMCVGLA